LPGSKKPCNGTFSIGADFGIALAIASAKGPAEPLKEIFSIEVLTKIVRRLAVESDHVLIRGDLNLSQLNLPIAAKRVKFCAEKTWRLSRCLGSVRKRFLYIEGCLNDP
jgi:hypothetical protein